MRTDLKMLAAIIAIVGSTALGWFGVLVSGMRCDDVCNDNASKWQRTSDAWQWTAIGGLSVAVFVVALATFAVVVRGRTARVWFAAWGVLVASLLTFVMSAVYG